MTNKHFSIYVPPEDNPPITVGTKNATISLFDVYEPIDLRELIDAGFRRIVMWQGNRRILVYDVDEDVKEEDIDIVKRYFH